MPPDSHPPSPLNFISQVARLYHSMAPFAGSVSDVEPSLGGKLLYAGELDAEGRALLVAANIAGAASLAATADAAMQRQAVRDGVADFLVTSLDEALRILKNEIRKRQPVAVCVALAPDAVTAEMLERGVKPDLLPHGGSHSPFAAQGAHRLQPASLDTGLAQLTWSVAQSPALWLPRLDAIALDCLNDDALWQLRWLRFAPRYLGRQAQGLRLLLCDREAGKKFIAEVNDRTARGEIALAVEIHLTDPDQSQVESFKAEA
jgi:urocanate hydratase